MNWSESNENYSEESRSENSGNQTERPARESRSFDENATRRGDGNASTRPRIERQPIYRAERRSDGGNSYSSPYGNRQGFRNDRPQQPRFRQGGYRDNAGGRSYNRYDGGEERNFNRIDNGERNYNRIDMEERNFNRIDAEERNYNRIDDDEPNYNRIDNGGGRNYSRQGGYPQRSGGYNNPPRGGYSNNRYNNNGGERRPYNANNAVRRPMMPNNRFERRPMAPQPERKTPLMVKKRKAEDEELRLNRFIAMSGVCSRRDADTLILEGRVKVNGELVQTVGVKVKRVDEVEVDGNRINPERKVYIVLNKPKDYVTTVEDPQERKTVMTLLEGACKERVYPIGRLDRQTTGVLLFTNDGDLSKKLTHPKYNHKKIYHVFLDKPLTDEDCEKIKTGIELEDGMIQADKVNYVTEADKSQIGVEIHSGRNRIVRRIFEYLGYQIIKLDRVYFAGITKKNLPRGHWRLLDQREISILKSY